MKRFLALFAIVAMVVSMFSGIAFAQANPDYKIELDNSTIIYRKGPNNSTFSGKILDYDSNAIVKEDFTLVIFKDEIAEETAINEVAVTNGKFSYLIPTYSSDYGVGNYIVAITEVDGEEYTDLVSKEFVIVYELELEAPTTLEYDFPVKGQQIIQGVFPNGDMNTDFDLILAYQDSVSGAAIDIGEEVATSTYLDKDSFGFLFSGASLTMTGDIGLYVVTGEDAESYYVVLALEGEVSADEMNLSASPLEFYTALPITQEITFEFDLGSSYVNDDEDEIEAGFKLYLSVEDDDEDAYGGNTDIDITNLFGDEDEQELVVDLNDLESLQVNGDVFTNIEDWAVGEYTLIVKLVDTTEAVDFTVEEAKITIEVVEPEEFTLAGWSLEEMTLSSKTIKIGEGNDIQIIYYEEGEDIEYLLSGTPVNNDYYVKVTYSGAGISEKTYNTEDDYTGTTFDNTGIELKPTKTGIIELVIKVYDSEDKVVATFEKEIEVTGYNIEVNPSEVLVDTENDFTVIITDEDGDVINNAVVVITSGDDEVAVVNSTSKNINNGTYKFTDVEIDTVGKYDVVAMTVAQYDGEFDGENNYKGILSDAIEVLGEEVLVVETDTPVMVNGVEEEIYVSVLDENGDVVYPVFEIIYYDEDGDDYDSIQNYDNSDVDTYNTTFVTSTRKDIDGDGVKEAIKLKVTPDKDTVEMVIRAYTDSDRKEMGEVTVEVMKPLVIHTGKTVITENFEVELEFTVVDPRDESIVFGDDIEIPEVDDYDYATVEYVDGKELDSDRDNVWTATLVVTDAAYDDAEDDEEVVEVSLKMGDVVLETIEIVKPSLTSNPEKVIIGSATNLILTYLDGEGNPLEGYTIELDGEEIGTTDEDGKVIYAASSVSSISLKFEAETDVDDEVATLTVKSTADVEGPTATIEVDGNTAIIRVVDNVRISKVMINGQLVDMFFAMPEVTHMVTLNPGVNTFNIQAVDINNNYKQTTLTAEPEKTASVEFTIGEATQYGTPVLTSGTTMIPVRFAESLGATISWDAPTATVTYTAGGIVIELTVGSTTAVVNGENVQLRVAPYINELNRTMVPLRMISEELGFKVVYTSMDAPITITK